MVHWEQKWVFFDIYLEFFFSELVIKASSWRVVALNHGDNLLSGDMGVGCIDQLTLLEQVEQLGHLKCNVLPNAVGCKLTLTEVLKDSTKWGIVLFKHWLCHFELFL